MKVPWIFFSPDQGLSDEELHHLRVLRVRKGDKVVGFDGKGGVYLCTFTGSDLEVVEEFKEEKPPETLLMVPLMRGEKLELILRYAPSFEVTKVVVFQAERSEVRTLPGERKLERWRKILLSGCKQSRNPWMPSIELKKLEELEEPTTAIFLDEEERERNMWDVNIKGDLGICFGPEGGLTEKEKNLLIEKGFVGVSLGRRVFTSELAPLVSLSIALFLRERAGTRPPCESWFFRLSRHKGI